MIRRLAFFIATLESTVDSPSTRIARVFNTRMHYRDLLILSHTITWQEFFLFISLSVVVMLCANRPNSRICNVYPTSINPPPCHTGAHTNIPRATLLFTLDLAHHDVISRPRPRRPTTQSILNRGFAHRNLPLHPHFFLRNTVPLPGLIRAH